VIEDPNTCTIVSCQPDSYECLDGIDDATCNSYVEPPSPACWDLPACPSAAFHPDLTCGQVDCGGQPCLADRD
jgi:hypothetical protein